MNCSLYLHLGGKTGCGGLHKSHLWELNPHNKYLLYALPPNVITLHIWIATSKFQWGKMKIFRLSSRKKDNLSSPADTKSSPIRVNQQWGEGGVVDGGLTQPAGLILSVVYAGQDPILNLCIGFIQHTDSKQNAMKHSETVWASKLMGLIIYKRNDASRWRHGRDMR